MNVILLNMSNFSDWQSGVVNRNFFVYDQLTRDPRVKKILAVDFLPIKAPAPFGIKRTLKYLYKNVWRQAAGQKVFSDLLSCCVKIKPNILLYSSSEIFFKPDNFWRTLNLLVKEHFSDDKNVLWVYNPFLADALEKFPTDLKVFDTVDNWSEHPSYRQCKSRLENSYQKIGRQADIIFVVAKELLQFYKNRSDVRSIPNGVEVEHFERVCAQPVPEDVKNIRHPIVGYIGTIQDRLDYDLLKFLAENNPDKSVVLVGPVWQSVQREIKEKLGNFKNVRFLGRKSYQDSPNYIKQFDVGIIPHKINAFINSMNPMKMYDYLACGKPVVSSLGAGVDMFPDLVVVAQTHEDFNQKIEIALKNDSPAQSQARIQQMRQHSWQSRVNEMLDIISERLNA